MANELIAIKQRLQNATCLDILGKDKDKYITSVLVEISKTTNDPKKDLSVCTPNSIVTAIKHACDLQLEIDSRQHCHLVKHNKNIGTDTKPEWISEASLWVGYRGYIYVIKRAYPDANIDCQLVYQGDTFLLKKEGDVTTYNLEVANAFAPKDKIIGGFCYISYTIGGRLISFCETVSVSEINKIKNIAKTKTIWDNWYEGKAKAAIIKRACKIHFSGIQEIAKVTEFDNLDYDLDKNVVVENDFIDTDQALDLEELLKVSDLSKEDFLKLYKIESLLDLPLIKLETSKAMLKNRGINASS